MRAPARAFALFACVLLAWVLLSVLSARAASADPAHRVYVGVYLRDVIRFDQRAGTFDVDMEVWVKWFGDFDPTKLRVFDCQFTKPLRIPANVGLYVTEDNKVFVADRAGEGGSVYLRGSFEVTD